MAFKVKDGDTSDLFLEDDGATGASSGAAKTPRQLISYRRDSATTNVTMDTATSSNNRGLPVVLLTAPASAPVSPLSPLSIQNVPSSTASTSDYATATNAAATITYSAAGSGIAHAIDGISFSLSASPSSAVALTVQDGSNVVFSVDITVGGAGFIPLRRRGTANTAMSISLGAGGSGVVGKVSVLNKFTVS